MLKFHIKNKEAFRILKFTWKVLPKLLFDSTNSYVWSFSYEVRNQLKK